MDPSIVGAYGAITTGWITDRQAAAFRLKMRTMEIEGPDCVAARRRHPVSGCQLRDQQRVIAGVDDASERGAAFPAFEAVAFKSAGIDARIKASAKRQPGVAPRTGDDSRVKGRGCWLGFQGPLIIEQKDHCANERFPTANRLYTWRARTVRKGGTANFTALIEVPITSFALWTV
jgi:hypothetical protein